MKQACSYNYNNAGCAYQCSDSSCAKNNFACAAFGAVCAFLLALNAIIIDNGAIISVIICVAIIIAVIIIAHNRIRAREVFLS